MTAATESLPYRACVGVVLFNRDGLVFVGERIDTPGAWQMPQGGIHGDETVEQAAFRELEEEIGTNSAEILKIAEKKTRYDLPKHLQGNLWGGRYRGQEQTWVAARYLGEDCDIDLEKDHHPEFRNWQWIKLKDALDLIVPFKKDTYKQVIHMFEEFGA